jgi:general secretion pathway protein C
MAYTLATTVASFFATPQPARIAAVPSGQSTDAARPAVNVNWILTKHLFGEAGAKPEVSESNQPAVQTRLPLELKSVFVADEKDLSAAIVAQRGKPGESYRVGDTLPGNAELVEVRTDRIILRRAGVRETLMFPEWQNQFAEEAAPAQRAPATNDFASDEADQFDESDGAGRGTADSEPLSAAEIADELRERLATEGESALEDYGLEIADGGGYRLGNAANAPYLRQTGLQPGDVILSVNGQPVGDVQQDQLQIENILAQGTARIEIQRGARRFTITASLPR